MSSRRGSVEKAEFLSHFAAAAVRTKPRKGRKSLRLFVPGSASEDAAAAAAAAAWSAAESPTWLDAAQARYFDARPNGHGAHSYVGRGLYALQLRLWLRHFPAEQIHVVDIDEMRDAVACVENMRRTFAFLGLPPHAIPDTAPKNTKEQRGRTYGPMDPTTHRRLDALFAPHNAELQRLAGVGGSW